MPHQRFPRQSAASSGEVATSSSSDVTTPGTASSGGLATTTSAFATATGLTSGIPSLSTSGAAVSLTPSFESATPTATSSSTGPASTSQSTSSSQSSTTSSSVPSTSSLTPTSSSSIPPSTTSSTTSPSSSVPPSTTTQPSSSQQGTLTTITSSYITYVNGSLVSTQTSFPSTIPASVGSSPSNRAVIIGGSAAGGTAVLILLLTLAFCARRKRFKRLHFLDAVTLKRQQIRSRATLLDGEDLTDVVDLQRPPRGYTDYETPWDATHSRDSSRRALMAGTATPGTPHTSMEPSQLSETGSAFKEDVWPLPHEGTRLMDPLANRDDLDLDLGRIVDDVMGPSSTAVHFSGRSVSSMYRDSVAGSEGEVHSRTLSTSSNAALLDAAGLGPPATAPVRSSPLAQPETKFRSVEHRGGNPS